MQQNGQCKCSTFLLALPQGASKSLVQLVTDLGNELKGSSEGKIVSIMEDFEHQIDGLGIKARTSVFSSLK